MIHIELWGTTPAPQGSKTPWGTEANPNTMPWREAIAAQAAAVMEAAGAQTIMKGPMGIKIVYYFPRVGSHFRSNGDLKPNAPLLKDSKPDLDKLDRAIGDALSKLVYRDDAQIASKHVTKQYGDRPGVVIDVYPL